jgi:hypothetical protein
MCVCELDGVHDVPGVCASRDDCGMAIDGVIPHPARFFEARIAGKNDFAIQMVCESVKCGWGDRGCGHAISCANLRRWMRVRVQVSTRAVRLFFSRDCGASGPAG